MSDFGKEVEFNKYIC